MFDIQKFGENDTVTSSSDLKLMYRFTDGDTRTTSIPDPITNIEATDIENVAATLQSTQAFVGDANNAPFDTITSAIIVDKTVTKLDIS